MYRASIPLVKNDRFSRISADADGLQETRFSIDFWKNDVHFFGNIPTTVLTVALHTQ